jgi:hypothetical protein
MRLIAHRGNTSGPRANMENTTSYIEDAFASEFDVEIDLWFDYGWHLGHDAPGEKIPESWLLENASSLWIHAKNLVAMEKLSLHGPIFNFFWHEKDERTLTSKGQFWTYPGKSLGKFSIAVMPEWDENLDINSLLSADIYGVCTDFVSSYKQIV